MQTPSARSAIRVIMREHQQLSVVIAGMQRFVELLGVGVKTPGLMVFRAMLYTSVSILNGYIIPRRINICLRACGIARENLTR
jgi:hypothetical protein